jgi:hypothetical protein
MTQVKKKKRSKNERDKIQMEKENLIKIDNNDYHNNSGYMYDFTKENVDFVICSKILEKVFDRPIVWEMIAKNDVCRVNKKVFTQENCLKRLSG